MDPFLAEIIMFGGNFNPRGWALCDGQLLPISQNQALFSLLGTIYGGDGRTTFALPELRGRVAMHPGYGPGLSSRRLGEKGGSQTNTLNVAQLPSHNHSATITAKVLVGKEGMNSGATDTAAGNYLGDSTGSTMYRTAPGDGTTSINGVQSTATVGHTGGGQSVNNIQPYLCINYIIAMQGVFPSRS